MAYQVLLVEGDLELASLTRDYLARHDIDISIPPDPQHVANSQALRADSSALLIYLHQVRSAARSRSRPAKKITCKR